MAASAIASVSRHDGRVCHRVREQTPHAGQRIQRLCQSFVTGEVEARRGQLDDPADHPHREPAPELRLELAGEQPEHRAFQRVARRQVRHAIVADRLANQVEELGRDPGALGTHPAHVHAQPGAVGRPELTGHRGPRRADEELLDVREGDQLPADLRQLQSRLPGQRLG
jgi:hypothetical protein